MLHVAGDTQSASYVQYGVGGGVGGGAAPADGVVRGELDSDGASDTLLVCVTLPDGVMLAGGVGLPGGVPEPLPVPDGDTVGVPDELAP